MAAGDEILAWKKEASKTKPERKTKCPLCAWPLEEARGVLHCPFDGWMSGVPSKMTKDELLR